MRTILIVDDSRISRQYHAAIVSSGGYQVVTAADGAEGLEKLLRQRCDLILTDINMQGLDGYEFIRRVRATADHSDIPVVIISSEGETKDRKKGYEAGANLYIAKPSEPQVLLDYIQMMIGGQS